MSGEHAQVNSPVIQLGLRRRRQRLVACSVCLRVRDGGTWIDAGAAIRRMRSFEHKHVVLLGAALCESCETELRLRRQREPEQLAA